MVKAQDYALPNLLPVKCFRELLGHLLGRRLGLLVPPVRLLIHDEWGRISTQRFLADAQTYRSEDLARLVVSQEGHRILLLDLIAANTDRRPANLLALGERVVPLDYNVAFALETEGDRRQRFDPIIMRWLGIEGSLRLGPSEWQQVLLEAARAQVLLSEEYLRHAVGQLREPFIDAEERSQVESRLLSRRARLQIDLEEWYAETVRPVFSLLEGARHEGRAETGSK